MNFFEAQEHARKASRKLVLWFSLCVLGVILLVYLALVSFLGSGNLFQPVLFLGTFVVVGGLILIGSLCKLARLSGGGSVIARDLGGREVDPSSKDPVERRLLNVVEEMAIASGVPAPEVWVMDHESGINAFAAGTDPSNAVIGVTRGTLDQLTRSELQGVIAHEYSHILNGDMKLNMRLTGWIFGLVMIAMLGRLLLESLRFMRGSRDSKGGGAILAIVLLGAAVWLIGSIGVLFARILQAAISRQREFLADAAAVQFTRYPEGISGALKKIGGLSEHGKIHAAKATEARHMFFASSSLSSMMATHPPLEERIRAIEPNWKGQMLDGGSDAVSPDEFKGAMGFAGSGTPPPIPEAVAAATEEAPALEQNDGTILAKATLFGLLIDDGNQEPGLQILKTQGYNPDLVSLAAQSSERHYRSPSSDKLKRIDAAIPHLRRMPPEQARTMVETVQKLIEADGQIELFEFMLKQVVQRNVEIGSGLRKPPAIHYKRIQELESEIANLLAVFSAVSGDDKALDPAAEEYRQHCGRELPAVEMDFDETASGLLRMDASTPIVKRQILRLCMLCAKQDGTINDHEAELLRAVAEALGCALPRTENGFADLS